MLTITALLELSAAAYNVDHFPFMPQHPPPKKSDFFGLLLLLLVCETKQTKDRSLGTCRIATHGLLYLHQYQSTHEARLLWWIMEGALGDDVLCCLLICSTVTV